MCYSHRMLSLLTGFRNVADAYQAGTMHLLLSHFSVSFSE